MKLFFFNPNNYGAEYTVMSETKERALEVVKEYLLKLANDNTKYDFYMEDYNDWKDATVDNLPEEYTIVEYDKDSVIPTENG